MPVASDKRSAASSGVAASERTPQEGALRMRDLVRLTGLPRETIHFYLTQGLLPKPLKTGRNTAVYGDEHLDRLQRIKDLQDRHFLPLRAIKAVLEEGAGGAFSEEQEALLRRVRSSLPPGGSAAGEVALSSIVPSKVSRADLDVIRRLGIVDVKGRGVAASVSAEDASVLECWAALRANQAPGESPLTPDMLGIYEDAITSLVARETRVVTQTFSSLPGKRVAELIDAGSAIVERLLVVLHRKRVAAVVRGTPAPGPSKR